MKLPRFKQYITYTNQFNPAEGVPTQIKIAQTDLVKLRQLKFKTDKSLARNDSKHWLALHKNTQGSLFVLLYDQTHKINCRAYINSRTGQLTILKGVDYENYSKQQDAQIIAEKTRTYLHNALNKKKVFITASPENKITPQAKTNTMNTDADTIARKYWNYLSNNYSFKDNDYHTLPEEVENIQLNPMKTLDCDDFALYMYKKFKENKISAKVVMIKKPYEDKVDNHTACIYQTKSGWKILDNVGKPDYKASDWKMLPGLLFKNTVSFTVFDVDNYWLQGKNQPENSLVWIKSIY